MAGREHCTPVDTAEEMVLAPTRTRSASMVCQLIRTSTGQGQWCTQTFGSPCAWCFSIRVVLCFSAKCKVCGRYRERVAKKTGTHELEVYTWGSFFSPTSTQQFDTNSGSIRDRKAIAVLLRFIQTQHASHQAKWPNSVGDPSTLYLLSITIADGVDHCDQLECSARAVDPLPDERWANLKRSSRRFGGSNLAIRFSP